MGVFASLRGLNNTMLVVKFPQEFCSTRTYVFHLTLTFDNVTFNTVELEENSQKYELYADVI